MLFTATSPALDKPPPAITSPFRQTPDRVHVTTNARPEPPPFLAVPASDAVRFQARSHLKIAARDEIAVGQDRERADLMVETATQRGPFRAVPPDDAIREHALWR